MLMTKEELNMVNGGTLSETSEDSQILKKKGYMKFSYDQVMMFLKWREGAKEVAMGWGRAGIKCEPNIISANRYFKNDEEITRGKALEMIGA